MNQQLPFSSSGHRLAWIAFCMACSSRAAAAIWTPMRKLSAARSWQTWRSGLIFGGRALRVAGARYAAPRPDQRTAVERLHLWDTSMQLALEAPLTGHGPGQWAVEYPRVAALQAEQQFRRFRLLEGPESFVTVRAFRQPVHAHQDLLEIGAELGLPAAAALLGVLLCSLGGLLSRSARRARAAAGVLAALLLMQASFPLSEPASACAIGALIALAAPSLRPKVVRAVAARGLSSRALHLGLALACATLAGVGALRLGAEFELASALHAVAASRDSCHRCVR